MRLYTAGELAKILQIPKNTVYLYGRTGELETIRVGGHVRFIMPTPQRGKKIKNEQQ